MNFSVHASSHLTRPQYRSDIDGLRAVAVLSVVGFHAFPNWIKGGFIGVDIFFVISGFLISTIIFGSLNRRNFSFPEFYSRRIKRIFPALLLVLIGSYAFGWFSLLPDEYQHLGKHIAGGAGFLSNYVLWHESGYFDDAAESKPLLHLWSLGIEEQFYIAWPFVAWFAWKQRWSLLALTLIVAALSFSLNVAGHNESVATFYSPQTRFWELLIGSALAYIALFNHKGIAKFANRSRDLQSLFGAALIGIGIFVITKERDFPGWWALFPTLGATLIISSGAEAWVNRVVLSNRVLVWFGLISFPLYLWHWPLLSYIRIVSGDASPRPLRVTAVIVSIALAWLTYQFLEKPIRFGEHGKTKTVILFISMACLMAVGIVTALNKLAPRNNSKEVEPLVVAFGDSSYPNQLMRYSKHREHFFYFKGDNASTTFLYGDSHIEQYSPRVVELIKHSGLTANTAVFATGGGCAPIPDVLEDRPLHRPCDQLRIAAREFMKRKDVRAIVIGACWNCYFIDYTVYPKKNIADYDYYFLKDGVKEYFRNGKGSELAFAELERFLKDIRKEKEVYLLLDNPSGPNFDPHSLVIGSRLTELHARRSSMTAQISPEQLKLRDQLARMAHRAGIKLVDPTRKLCEGQSCLRQTDDGRPLYKDDNHLRPFFVRENADFLDVTLFVK